MHPDSFSSRGDYTGSPQISEVPANLWLIRFEYFHEKTDAHFLLADQVDNAQPG